ncbi:MAG: YceI family protein [Planctomycetes bacterium]|nr:YceI family protein [Planctomycetota bacterium]
MQNVLKISEAFVVLLTTTLALAGWNSTNSNAQTRATAQDTATATTREYVADSDHSNVLFKIRHGVTNFYSRFNDIKGSINFDKDHIENSSMTFTVPIASVDTHNTGRDGFIKGANFFNDRQYPEATFTSTSIKPLGDGVYSLTGELTLHGKTNTIEAKLLDIRTGKVRRSDVVGFEVRFTFKRSDYGMTKFLDPKNPESGLLGDTIEMIVAIEAAAK